MMTVYIVIFNDPFTGGWSFFECRSIIGDSMLLRLEQSRVNWVPNNDHPLKVYSYRDFALGLTKI